MIIDENYIPIGSAVHVDTTVSLGNQQRKTRIQEYTSVNKTETRNFMLYLKISRNSIFVLYHIHLIEHSSIKKNCTLGDVFFKLF